MRNLEKKISEEDSDMSFRTIVEWLWKDKRASDIRVGPGSHGGSERRPFVRLHRNN